MATGAQVFDMLMRGSQNNRARREQDYLERRREIEDPYKDSALARNETAMSAIVDQYGPQAGAPEAQATVTETARRVERQPEDLRNARLQGDIMERGLEDRLNDRAVGAMRNVLTGIKKSNADPAAAFAQIPPRVKQALGLTPEDETEIVGVLTADPNNLDLLIEALSDPEGIRQMVTFNDDGTPMFATVGERGTVSPLNIGPERPTDLDIQEQRARIAAIGRQNQPKGGSEADAQTAEAQMQIMFDRAWDALDAAAGGGAYASSEDPDWLRRGIRGIGASSVGRYVSGLAGTKQEELRDNVDAAVSGLRMLFIENPNITSRMFDTPAEQKALMQQLEGGTSIESKIQALQWTERRFRQRLGDTPATASPGTGQPAAPVAGGVLRQNADGSFTWSPGE